MLSVAGPGHPAAMCRWLSIVFASVLSAISSPHFLPLYNNQQRRNFQKPVNQAGYSPFLNQDTHRYPPRRDPVPLSTMKRSSAQRKANQRRV